MDIHEDDLNEIRKDLADMEAKQEAEYEAYLMDLNIGIDKAVENRAGVRP